MCVWLRRINVGIDQIEQQREMKSSLSKKKEEQFITQLLRENEGMCVCVCEFVWMELMYNYKHVFFVQDTEVGVYSRSRRPVWS